MKLLIPLAIFSFQVSAVQAALMLQYTFEGATLSPTTTTDPTVLTGSALTANLPATVGSTSNTTALRRLYYADYSGYDNDSTLAVQTQWGNTTPLFRVQTGRTDLQSSIDNNSYFTITLIPQQMVSLASLAFDVAGTGNADYPFGLTVRSSLTGTQNLFSTSFVAGLEGAPDFVNLNLTAYEELQEVTENVTFTFYLYASGRNDNLTIDNISFYTVPEPGSMILGGLGAIGLLMRRRRNA